ncbi:porin family protein [Ferruginibacter paludis]|uniref:porin family protein n=1 Tax=Ferruginibacter TaxID=1004303 RepID=UPI0025B3406A|nr:MULTISPECIES: porin family protein [Ferruginibacter]MDB5279103.1 PorT family protein [Ferruginibacter sp.]MDN3658630.1 porin family protein [Ferruginibacter paludis]
MKKMTTVLLVTVIAMSAKAQFYVQGGVNLANITTTNSGQTEKNKWLTSFNAGVLGRFGISNSFDLESGVLFTGKGSKAETYFNGGADYVKTKFNPLYLEVPLNAVVKIPLDTRTKSNVFFHAGPYIAVGVAGKSTVDGKLGPVQSTSSSNIKFSNDDPFTSAQDDAAYNKLKRFDYGLNIGGGVDFGKLLVKANYGYGLAKINSTQSNNTADDKNKFRTWSVSLGIPLGR